MNINNIIIREFYAMRVSEGVSSPLLSAKDNSQQRFS
ncbi:Uncharacterised protein [Vibrio cholerae]|nr:Uncharacterised protein [Vibrio cholerae]